MELIGQFVIAGLWALGVIAWLRKREGRSAEADPDLAVIQQLKKVGSDLSKPHPVEFFLYFLKEENARAALKRAENAGFTGEVARGAEDVKWLCFLTRTMRPDHGALTATRRELEQLASELDGEYDGWGTPVVN